MSTVWPIKQLLNVKRMIAKREPPYTKGFYKVGTKD
jgi:hypothetical protein